jgi:hypothetical protein
VTARRGYELKTPFLGRPIRPFHFAIAISTAVIAWLCFMVENDTWSVTAAGHVLGTSAVISTSFLTIGWWRTSDWFAEWGLLTAAGVWSTRAFYIFLTGETVINMNKTASILLSVAWVIGALGAYVLERYDHVESGGRE